MAGLAELVGSRDTTGTTANDDVIVGGLRGGLAFGDRATRAASRVSLLPPAALPNRALNSPIAGGLRGLRGQSGPLLIRLRRSTLEHSTPLSKAVVVESESGGVGAAGLLEACLRGGTAEDEVPSAGRDVARGPVLVPGKAVLAAEEDLEAGVADGRRDLSQLGVTCVERREGVAGGVAEGGVDGALAGVGDEQQRLRHLTGLAVRDGAVSGSGGIGNSAALRKK